MKKAVIYFTKVPVHGFSKTRLQGFISDHDISKLSENLILHGFQQIKGTQEEYFIYATPHERLNELESLLNEGVHLQVGANLGERMLNAFKEVRDLGYEKMVLMGSDIYDIDSELIREAFEELNHSEIVVSPTTDGGYSLIGMKEVHDFCFRDKVYSTDKVFEELLDSIKESGKSFGKLRTTNDIDDEEDLVKLITGEENPVYIGSGEYNTNILVEGVLYRIAGESQMGIVDQIGYEYNALRELQPSGAVPKVYGLFTEPITGIRYLKEEYLTGRHLDYDVDLEKAAKLLAQIHSLEPNPKSGIIKPKKGFAFMYDECNRMFSIYEKSKHYDDTSATEIKPLLKRLWETGLDEPVTNPCIINTELNNRNFIIGEKSRVIDWEKPIIGDREQDIAHFLAPTTTYWKTDKILSQHEIERFIRFYDGFSKVKLDRRKLNKYLGFTCLRGITWCAMAYCEYLERDERNRNSESFSKIEEYLSKDFLDGIKYLMGDMI